MGKSIAPALIRPRRLRSFAPGWSGHGVASLRVVQYGQSRTEHSRRVPSFPAAFVRDIARPAPWTVECSAAPASADSTPSRITAGSPIVAPTKPRWPGKAGVAPLRTTHAGAPSTSSRQA